MKRDLAPFGAALRADGTTRFRLWAPGADKAALDVEHAPAIEMAPVGDGWFEADAPCGAGAAYCFRVNGLSVPDPAARAQRGGAHGRSLVADPSSYRWRNDGWKGRPWREAVIYELHAGALGGFRGVARELPRLRDLGVTAVELMPVSAFPGARNWGYDGVLPFAPAEAYGAPDDLKALVDDAHGHGLLIYLDVVYNHFGPDGNYLHVYAPHFFHAGRANAWGPSIDFSRREVRDFFTANVLYWLNEYRFDGLRFDAVHAIEESDWLEEMAAIARAAIEPGREVHLVLENDDNAARHLGRGRFDAQWNDDAHHVLHLLLTGEADGYYRDYADAPAARLARSLAEGFVYQGEPSAHRGGRPRGEKSAHLPPTAFVLFLQNHDQIGNRAFGERLTTLADPQALEAAIALQCLCPQPPLIFMGEETASASPFLFFTDHGEELAKAVRAGRAREFGGFASFSGRSGLPLPDPNIPASFEASRPTPDPERGPARTALYRRLLSLRAQKIAPRLSGAMSIGADAIGEAAVKAAWRLGDGSRLTIAVNLGAGPAGIDGLAGDLLHESMPGAAARARGGSLDGRAAVAFLEPAA